MICYNCFREKAEEGACPHCGYDPVGSEQKYPMALKPGSILNGRYITGRVLGQGGFGITYIAQDDKTKDRVAIKEYLPAEFAGREPGSNVVQPFSEDRRDNFDFGKEKFLEEAKTLAAFIGDEHIVRIYNYFEENGTAYFTMEYVEGLPLNRYMAGKGGKLSREETNDLLLPLMEALKTVHAKGIVHRDIAPDNIIVQPNGQAKLIDFGAARYSTGEKSQSLDVVIKHGFAPKEQYTRRGRQGPFTDVYAMAATYYYAITGQVLPDAVDRMEEDTLASPSSLGIQISEAAENALAKALEISATDRYQTMGEFRLALTEADPELAARAAEERARREQERREKEAADRARRERAAAERAKRAEELRQEKNEAKPAPARQKKRTGMLALVAGGIVVAVLAVLFLLPKGEKAEPAVPQEPAETAAPVSTPAPTEIPEATEAPAAELPGAETAPVKTGRPLFTDDRQTIAFSNSPVICVLSDGWVEPVPYASHYKYLREWKNVAAVDGWDSITAALQNDGRVIVGHSHNNNTQDVFYMDGADYTAISVSRSYLVALHADGTVSGYGSNANGQCDVSGWKDIVSVSAGYWHTVGLRSDGTVVAVGSNANGQCNVSGWTDIVAVSAGYAHTVGLRSDGTVAATGKNALGQCDVEDWRDIVAVCAGNNITLGLRSDGTVVMAGRDPNGQCNVSGWTDVVYFSIRKHDDWRIIAVRSDGTILQTGKGKFSGEEISILEDAKLPF